MIFVNLIGWKICGTKVNPIYNKLVKDKTIHAAADWRNKASLYENGSKQFVY